MRASVIIENILREYPQSRNSDRFLMLAVWHRLGFKLTPEQREIFMNLPSSETIRRIRQKLQEEGKYLADKQISQHRRIKSMEVQQRMPQTKSERVEPLLTPREVESAKRVVGGQTKLI